MWHLLPSRQEWGNSFNCKIFPSDTTLIDNTENGLSDARGHDLTLIVMIDWRVDLSLSQGRWYGDESYPAVLNSRVA